MSGAFGWHGGSNRDRDYDRSSGYSSARSAYSQPVSPPRVKKIEPKKPAPKPDRQNTWQEAAKPLSSIPEAKHTLRSTAENVAIIVTDLTGSMDEWPKEIFKRLPLMYAEVQKYLGQDLEFLFIAHHDAHSDNDHRKTNTTQVTRFGRGPELDGLLASFGMAKGTGGGQGYESHELVAYYLLHQVDTSTAKTVFCYFITDERPFDTVESNLVRTELGLSGGDQSSKEVFRSLQQKMNVFSVLRRTTNYPLQVKKIDQWWVDCLGQERVLRLNDHRRAVDVMLGAMAATIGQKEVFTQDLQSRQGPTRHGTANIHTVMQSIAFVGPTGPSTEPITNPTKGLLD